jgi:DNA-binding transcriptional regulator YdaS (Cro superfamily)
MSTAQHSTAQHSTAQHSTAQHNPLRLLLNLVGLSLYTHSQTKTKTISATSITSIDNIAQLKTQQAQYKHQAHISLASAINLVGGQVSLAKLIGTTQGRISVWLNRDKKVPFDQVIAIENALKNIKGNTITRYELRPDIYGDKPTVKSLLSDALDLSIDNTKISISRVIYTLLRSPVKLLLLLSLIILIGTSSLQNLTSFGVINTQSQLGTPTILSEQNNSLNNNIYGTAFYSEQNCAFGINN